MVDGVVVGYPQSLVEPLSGDPNRAQWVAEEAARTARAHKSYLQQHLSSNTVHNMQSQENFELADADGGGTIDKQEFAVLLEAAGGKDNAADMALLFANADKDGDGELTAEEIATLTELKKAQS